MTGENSICVIMPAFNEEKSVGAVLDDLSRRLPGVTIVVIDDGSRDRTAFVAREHGAEVLQLPHNLGIGGAVQTGLKFAKREGFDVAIEVDADGQHDPKFTQDLIVRLQKGDVDMVIGSRFVKNTAYRSSVLRMFGIHVFSALIKFVTGVRVYDSTSGYRAYSRRAIEFLAPRYPIDFPEPESIVLLLSRGMRIAEVPVEMKKRESGESVVGRSDFSLKAAYFVISNSIAILLTGMRQKVRYVR